MMKLDQAYNIIAECENGLYEAWKGYSDGEKIVYTFEQYREAKAVILCGEDIAIIDGPDLRIVR